MTAGLIATFIVVPVLELYLILRVSWEIGLGATLLLLFGLSALGGVIVRREGARAWRALREAAGAGRMPGREAADGALILAGGVLMLTPGFFTDAVGLVLVLPVTRPLARRLLGGVAARRATRLSTRWPGGPAPGERPRSHPGGRVVDAEVVDAEVADPDDRR